MIREDPMKNMLTNKKGVTLLEGLIALMLLALVATGTFSVLLSSSRKSTAPDIQEAMVFAVEEATQKLNLYSYAGEAPDRLDGKKLCKETTPTEDGDHNISCLLPPICDVGNSSFTYTISSDGPNPVSAKLEEEDRDDSGTAHKKITFKITCNGYSL